MFYLTNLLIDLPLNNKVPKIFIFNHENIILLINTESIDLFNIF